MESGPSVYLGYRTKGWRQSMLAPFRRDAEKGAPDRRATSRRRRGNGHEQPVAFTVRRDTCLSSARRGSTHTQHVAIPEPTTVKYSRATDCRRSRAAHVGGRFIVVRARKPRELRAGAGIGEAGDNRSCGSHVLARRRRFFEKTMELMNMNGVMKM